MKLKMLILLGCCFVGAGKVSAQEVIDVFPGTDQISTAIMGAFPGDIIQLNEGEYTETQTLVIPLDLTIRGAEGATVKWEVPTTVQQGIHVKANVHFENIIFHTDPDTLPSFADMIKVDCIWNMFGSVTDGQENEATGNSIYVDQCQFIGFYRAVFIPDGEETPDGKVHPLDTLIVTNSLFYGGGKYKPYRGIEVDFRQGRNVRIQNCTFWNMHGEAAKIKGFGFDAFMDPRFNQNPGGIPEYMQVVIDHCTFYEMGLPPIAVINGVGVYVEYTSADDSIKNCVFYDISDFGIKSRHGAEVHDEYIDYHVADPNIGWKAGCGVCQPYHYELTNLGSHAIEADPMFVDPDNGDFSFKAGSLALTGADDGGPVGSRIQLWNPGTWNPPTTVEDKAHLSPTDFALEQNFPNPFNPTTTISFSLPEMDLVTLTIYSITGQKVRTLVDEVKQAGAYSVVWDALDDLGKQVTSGVYFYRLRSGAVVETKKMLLIH